ncbi:type II CAAX endopeptidase family protein [Brachybacterium phenoliresistens]|uniref:CAAX protease n=1 Tax=Brachybacterium phenoliresistens TaxID=396014 RepID=Z9JQK9_9MICO|nr:type II CAAX endopeptidase family protein [Brachybacterium phenoliresistens]EWS80056.1 CAAX protease [Brachybacterium phenoliresistens]
MTSHDDSSLETAPSSVELRRVLAFAVLALGASTAVSLPFALGMLPIGALAFLVPLVQLAPMVAALLVRRRDRPWWRALGLGVPSWPRLGVMVLVAVAAFALVPTIRVMVSVAAGAAPASDGLGVPGLLVALPMVLIAQTVFAIGEETGWRGWLQQQLAPLGFWTSSAAIGLLWALWHLPIVLALGMSATESVLYLGTIVVVAPLLSALSTTAGTVWAAVLGHGLLNSLRVGIDQGFVEPLHPGAGLWIVEGVTAVLWLAAAAVVLTFARPLRSQAPPGDAA